ncbi:MAG: BatA domain-containing protein, partial [Pirellula sp.]
MTFLHASLLLGGLAAVIPIVLHMLGRRQPKPIVFPAIRFVRQTAINAQRGWSIKRWILLTLRILLVALLAIAFASPRVQSNMFATYLMIGLIGILALVATAAALTSFGSNRSVAMTAITGLIALVLWGVSGTWLGMAVSTGQSVLMPTASGPICAAVVIDTSPTMGYRYHNVTRLDAAKEMALWLMDRLPVGSQIAIVNNDSGVRLNQDRISANRLLDRTIVEGRAANLPQRISASIDALRKSELERREIYVLTD